MTSITLDARLNKKLHDNANVAWESVHGKGSWKEEDPLYYHEPDAPEPEDPFDIEKKEGEAAI